MKENFNLLHNNTIKNNQYTLAKAESFEIIDVAKHTKVYNNIKNDTRVNYGKVSEKLNIKREFNYIQSSLTS